MAVDAFKGVFREDSWATPLLAMSVITLCSLLLYTVICFCFWIKPSSSRKSSLLPWLQIPFLFGLICLASISIVAAVPLNDGSCRMLFIGPGVAYALLAAGLLSRIIQHTMRAHVFLQWLLIFFVVLNQLVISIAYVLRSARKICVLTIHDQLFMMLYPALLIGVVLLLVYRTARSTRSQWKSRQAIHVGLAATFSGAFAGCWLGAACVLGDALLSSCIGFGCLVTCVIVSLIALIPRQDRIDSNDDSIYSQKEEVIYHEERDTKDMHKIMEYESRSSEKLNMNDPEIIIVPITTDGQTIPDIALQAINKARNSQYHLNYGGNRRSRDYADGSRHHHHHQGGHQRSPHRWHNKLRTDMSIGRRTNKTLRSRKDITGRGTTRNNPADKIHRTPYNHRGWLY